MGKLLATLLTLEVLDAGVNVVVLGEVALVGEQFPTFLTLEPFNAGMSERMLCEVEFF